MIFWREGKAQRVEFSKTKMLKIWPSYAKSAMIQTRTNLKNSKTLSSFGEPELKEAEYSINRAGSWLLCSPGPGSAAAMKFIGDTRT